jgi:hypothetical protein
VTGRGSGWVLPGDVEVLTVAGAVHADTTSTAAARRRLMDVIVMPAGQLASYS